MKPKTVEIKRANGASKAAAAKGKDDKGGKRKLRFLRGATPWLETQAAAENRRRNLDLRSHIFAAEMAECTSRTHSKAVLLLRAEVEKSRSSFHPNAEKAALVASLVLNFADVVFEKLGVRFDSQGYPVEIKGLPPKRIRSDVKAADAKRLTESATRLSYEVLSLRTSVVFGLGEPPVDSGSKFQQTVTHSTEGFVFDALRDDKGEIWVPAKALASLGVGTSEIRRHAKLRAFDLPAKRGTVRVFCVHGGALHALFWRADPELVRNPVLKETVTSFQWRLTEYLKNRLRDTAAPATMATGTWGQMPPLPPR